MITYAQEKLKAVLPEIEAMVPEQWEEMAQGFEGMTYEPNWTLYLAAEERGAGMLLTAREDEVMLGYFGFLVHPHLSSQSQLAATSTPYYVRKMANGGTRGLVLRSLIRESVKKLKVRGVALISIRTHHWASAGTILESLRFKPFETSYMLRL